MTIRNIKETVDKICMLYNTFQRVNASSNTFSNYLRQSLIGMIQHFRFSDFREQEFVFLGVGLVDGRVSSLSRKHKEIVVMTIIHNTETTTSDVTILVNAKIRRVWQLLF